MSSICSNVTDACFHRDIFSVIIVQFFFALPSNDLYSFLNKTGIAEIHAKHNFQM